LKLSLKNRMKLFLFIGKVILGTLLLVLISLTITYLIWSEGRIIHGVSMGGIRLGGMKVKEATSLLRKEVGGLDGGKVILLFKNRPLNIVLNSIGIKLDVAESIVKAYQIGRNGSFWNQMASRWRIYRYGYETRPVFNNNRVSLNSFFHLLEASINVEPVRSAVKVNKEGIISFTASRAGLVIDQSALAEKLENAVFHKDVSIIEIPIKKVVPPLTEDDIKRWGMDQVLGIFTTKYEMNQEDRAINLLIASSAINNVIVYPGQIFSFNTWVGPRVTEAGYKQAPVVYLGKLIPGVGGGVCQVSSTLYNAALLSNLKVIQRLNHSLPVSYAPLARDATVVYDGVDLIIENTSQFPILIVSNVAPPHLTVAILGRKTNWKRVELETKIIETYPFQTKTTTDPSLTKGSKKKVISGRKGIKAELWREVEYIDGSLKKELVNTSIYPAQPEEYRVGIKPD
jgi:vancomycin resistance protein YoaR